MQEERAPLLCFGAVGLGAAAEFELAVEVSDEAGLAERRDEFALGTDAEVIEEMGGLHRGAFCTVGSDKYVRDKNKKSGEKGEQL